MHDLAAVLALNGVTSNCTPGPIVEHKVALLTYLPLAADGFALMTAWIKLFVFSSSFPSKSRSCRPGRE